MKLAEIVLLLEMDDEFEADQEGGLGADIVAAIHSMYGIPATVRSIHGLPERDREIDISTEEKRKALLRRLSVDIKPLTLNDCTRISQADDVIHNPILFAKFIEPLLQKVEQI